MNLSLNTLNNFCPSIFSQVCPDFHFLQNPNLYQIVCLDFLVSNANLYSKSRHTVQICVLKKSKFWTRLRKYRRTEIVEGFRLRGLFCLLCSTGNGSVMHILMRIKRHDIVCNSSHKFSQNIPCLLWIKQHFFPENKKCVIVPSPV